MENPKSSAFKPSFDSMKIERNLLSRDDMAKNAAFGRAISSETRLHMLRLILSSRGITISKIAETLNMAVSSASFHLKILEDAGIINISFIPSKKGRVQICQMKISSVDFSFESDGRQDSETVIKLHMPVGHYVDARFDFIAGFSTKTKEIMFDHDDYFKPERVEAELLWCRSGFAEYAFSNIFKRKNIKELIFSLEICSETIAYQNNWKSDITFSLNKTELLTWTSPGDFGGRRGVLNPDWWPDGSSQYGLLKKISVTSDGVYLDGDIVNKSVTLNQFNLNECGKLLFKVENKDNAKHKGGFNIFGKSFGDYPQDIMLTAVFYV